MAGARFNFRIVTMTYAAGGQTSFAPGCESSIYCCGKTVLNKSVITFTFESQA
jgi:hypothetical protein